MLTIRKEQIQVFLTNNRDRFVEHLMGFFATQWPQQTARLGAAYRPFIESSIDRALSYGIDTKASIARFVNVCLVLGLDFELRPENRWALTILNDRRLRGSLKAHELAFRTTLELKKRERLRVTQ